MQQVLADLQRSPLRAASRQPAKARRPRATAISLSGELLWLAVTDYADSERPDRRHEDDRGGRLRLEKQVGADVLTQGTRRARRDTR